MSSLHTAAASPAHAPIARMATGFISTLVNWDRRYRATHHIAHLEDRLLQDVGLRRSDLNPAAAPLKRRD